MTPVPPNTLWWCSTCQLKLRQSFCSKDVFHEVNEVLAEYKSFEQAKIDVAAANQTLIEEEKESVN